jgi:hypothetical protein
MESVFCLYPTLFTAAERLFAATPRGLCRRRTRIANVSPVRTCYCLT